MVAHTQGSLHFMKFIYKILFYRGIIQDPKSSIDDVLDNFISAKAYIQGVMDAYDGDAAIAEKLLDVYRDILDLVKERINDL